MVILINNIQDKIRVPVELTSLLEQIGSDLLQLEGQPRDSEVSIILIDDEYIRELNLTYRGQDRPTDVLAFCLQDDMTGMEEDKVLGDVLISVERAAGQAQEYGHSLKREVAFLAAHGILHLLGYDHKSSDEEEEMKSRQIFILERFEL